jgi:hypothetical protein
MEVINEVLQDTINDRYIFITYSEDGEVSGIKLSARFIMRNQLRLLCRLS